MPVRVSPSFSMEKARMMQLQLAKRVSQEDELPEIIKLVAGVDVAYAGEVSIGAAVVLDYDSLSLLEAQTSHTRTRFPYVPTLLSLREIPPALSALKKLRMKPDVFLVDGHGRMHPRRLGFASHLGLVADVPTVGVAKSPLCGEAKPLGERLWAPVVDGGEAVGASVLTKPGNRPVYVSVGHRVSLNRTVKIILHCAKGSRIPEPIRKAHIIANKEKRGLKRQN